MIRFFKRKTRAFRRGEDGNVTVEFVVVLPLIFSIFMMSFESGLLMMRSVMLERAVDLTMRELRLGQIVNPTSAALKTRICNRTVIINNCNASIRIEMLPMNLSTWNIPTTPPACVDRTQAIQAAENYNPGGQHELMLTRICVLQRAIFPTLGLGDQFVGLGRNLTQGQPGGHGEYGLIVVSSFVNEPT
ncbi:MAG: pilus assembly protein [Rhodobacteraceae bacterium]|jgi:TadE-like protein|nr:pilus assembly protein [Paracoccaceae bacterium]